MSLGFDKAEIGGCGLNQVRIGTIWDPRNEDGRILWGAAEPPHDRNHTSLPVLGGMEAHHWAVNVTGAVVQHRRDGITIEWLPRLDEDHQQVVEVPTAHWLAIFDTSASVLSVPDMVAQEVLQYLDDRNLVDCGNTSRLPVLTVEMNGLPFELRPEDYLS